MPVHKIPGGYQYGETGKKYYGKDAKEKAELQARAIERSRHKDDDKPASMETKGTIEEIGRRFLSRYLASKVTID